MSQLGLPFVLETLILLATIAAIIYGPVRAVKVTRQLDAEREQTQRKYQILSDLMRTRRARLDPLHVSALNLIELEFYGNESIRSAYRTYAKHLNSHFPQESEALDRHLREGDDLFNDLLQTIALDLGYSFDKGDLERLGYLPQGLGRHYDNSMINAQLTRDILEGRRALPITNFISNDAIFPPPPNRVEQDQ